MQATLKNHRRPRIKIEVAIANVDAAKEITGWHVHVERKTRNDRPRFWCWPVHQQEALELLLRASTGNKRFDMSTLNLQTDDSFNHLPSFFFLFN